MPEIINDDNNVTRNNIDPTQDPSLPYYIHPSDSQYKILLNQFNGSGYNDWKYFVIISLSAKNKLGFIDGIITKPRNYPPLFKVWSRCNSTLIAWFIQVLDVNIAKSILYSILHKRFGKFWRRDLVKPQAHKSTAFNNRLLILNKA